MDPSMIQAYENHNKNLKKPISFLKYFPENIIKDNAQSV